MLENIEFLGHASFKIKGSKIIYTDPYEIFEEETADIILITHSHFDHLSVKDIKNICNWNTTIVASKDCIDSLQNLPCYTIGLEPFQDVNINGVHINAFPAYNINKEFHPKEKKWNGYVFELDGIRYYHPGDTDKIPEMEQINADIIFLPVGGTYTMDFKEAASVVSIINPKKAVPMHYGTIVGSIGEAEAFIKLVGDTGSIIPQKKP